MTIHRLDLPHATGRTPIHIGVGIAAQLASLVPELVDAGRAMVVCDARLRDSHGDVVCDALTAAGLRLDRTEVVARESEKTLTTIEHLAEGFASARAERGTPIVAIGGGITGDVAGFAAASWLRGVPVVQVPTTLLAMVDAAIGGKTGVNLPRPDGTLAKNLIGAFWQPIAVVADPTVLGTLDERDYRCGFAEAIKHGMLADPALLDRIERGADAWRARDVTALTDLVAAAVRVKVDTVAADEREAGRRAHLNLGHTFAHAIEALGAADVRHGEAVAIGLVAAAHVGTALGRLDAGDAARLTRILDAVGLPTRLPAALDTAALMAAMRLDKKVAGGTVRLVIAGPPGTCAVLDDVPDALVVDAWQAVGAGGAGGADGARGAAGSVAPGDAGPT